GGNPTEAVRGIRGAERALDQAGTLLDAIDSAGSDIRHAAAELPAALTDAQDGVDAARRLAGSGTVRLEENRRRLDEAVAQVESALSRARRSKDTDPLGAYEAVVESDSRLDSVYADTAERVERNQRARELVDRTLDTARARLDAAESFLAPRRGG